MSFKGTRKLFSHSPMVYLVGIIFVFVVLSFIIQGFIIFKDSSTLLDTTNYKCDASDVTSCHSDKRNIKSDKAKIIKLKHGLAILPSKNFKSDNPQLKQLDLKQLQHYQNAYYHNRKQISNLTSNEDKNKKALKDDKYITKFNLKNDGSLKYQKRKVNRNHTELKNLKKLSLYYICKNWFATTNNR